MGGRGGSSNGIRQKNNESNLRQMAQELNPNASEASIQKFVSATRDLQNRKAAQTNILKQRAKESIGTSMMISELDYMTGFDSFEQSGKNTYKGYKDGHVATVTTKSIRPGAIKVTGVKVRQYDNLIDGV